MKKIAFSLFFILITGILPQNAQGKTYEIKFANLAPEGTAWSRVMKEMDLELQKETQGRMKFKFYWGGVMGDEPDMIRKMRIGQLQGAGLTGAGLGVIAPSVRVLELPRLFDSPESLDAAKSALQSNFDKEFSKSGYKFVGWGDVGSVYLFTSKPIKTLSDMQGVKMWLWEGDPLAGQMYEALGLNPTPLAITDVLTSLQTEMIDGFYCTPMAAMALQWHSQAKYTLNYQLSYAMGAFVVTKKFFKTLPPELQATFLRVSKKHSERLTQQTRVDNKKAFKLLQSFGIQSVTLSKVEEDKISSMLYKAWDALVGKMYSQSLLDQVKKIAGGKVSVSRPAEASSDAVAVSTQ
jgi:TRAP-type transport system periplasmic protein